MAYKLWQSLLGHHLPRIIELAPGQQPVDHAEHLACRQYPRPLVAVMGGFTILPLVEGLHTAGPAHGPCQPPRSGHPANRRFPTASGVGLRHRTVPIDACARSALHISPGHHPTRIVESARFPPRSRRHTRDRSRGST